MENKPANQKLRDWLNDEGRKIVWLAKRIRADRATVHQWLNGKQVPRPVHRAVLEEVTGGAVLSADWEKAND